jgi:hypothetical protein
LECKVTFVKSNASQISPWHVGFTSSYMNFLLNYFSWIITMMFWNAFVMFLQTFHVIATKFSISKNYNHFLSCKCKSYVNYHTKSTSAFGYLSLDVFNFVIIFSVKRYLSHNRSKFMWMMGLIDIMTFVFIKNILFIWDWPLYAFNKG